MNPLIIDASVAAKWSFADETLSQEAAALLDRYDRRELQLFVPDLFWTESGNILWKAVRRGRCSRVDAKSHMAALKALQLPTVSSEDLIELAFDIASDFDRTVYDSVYIALAMESYGQLVTADEKLANAVASRLPVRWLGAWS